MLYLASQSPQRSSILQSLSVEFSCLQTNFDEKSANLPSLSPTKLAEELAKSKLMYALSNKSLELTTNDVVIASDTIVFLDKKTVYGKPTSLTEAEKMLRSYSGKRHYVVTAIAGFSKQKNKILLTKSVSKVMFAKLSNEDIQFLLNTNEWQEAAGGYRIQGKSSIYIKKIIGSYSGILGLPIHELSLLLKRLQVPLYR